MSSTEPRARSWRCWRIKNWQKGYPVNFRYKDFSQWGVRKCWEPRGEDLWQGEGVSRLVNTDNNTWDTEGRPYDSNVLGLYQDPRNSISASWSWCAAPGLQEKQFPLGKDSSNSGKKNKGSGREDHKGWDIRTPTCTETAKWLKCVGHGLWKKDH